MVKKQSQQYSELHLFIDESGILNSQPSQDNICFVGGVIFWGKYESNNESLMKCLTEALYEVYASTDLENLHYFNENNKGTNYKSYWDQKNLLLRKIKQKITDWYNAHENHLWEGISIIHKEDIHRESSYLVSEDEIDNRYVHMLRSLLEQLLFVDDRINERLQPGAKIYLHIATRTAVFYGTNEQKEKFRREQMKNLGYSPEQKPDKKDRFDPKIKTSIYNVLDESELRGILRDIQERWPNSIEYNYRISFDQIEYKQSNKPSLAGLYLADLWLGKKKPNYQKEHVR